LDEIIPAERLVTEKEKELGSGFFVLAQTFPSPAGAGLTRDPACRDKLTRAVREQTKTQPSKLSCDSFAAWVNACSLRQVANAAFEMVCHRARKMSFSRRSVGSLVFRW
jgi:hypothetical protein